jgi:RHS repeat-associated protein
MKTCPALLPSAGLSDARLCRALVLGFALSSTAVLSAESLQQFSDMSAKPATDTYYLSDHLATTVTTVDAAGIIAEIETDAFGGAVIHGKSAERYTGKPYDFDIESYVYPTRYYRADMMKWISADPSGFIDDTNNSKYLNSPFDKIDILGLESYVIVCAKMGPWSTGDDTGGYVQSIYNEALNIKNQIDWYYNYYNAGDPTFSLDVVHVDNFNQFKTQLSSGYDHAIVVAHNYDIYGYEGYTGSGAVALGGGGTVKTFSEIYGLPNTLSSSTVVDFIATCGSPDFGLSYTWTYSSHTEGTEFVNQAYAFQYTNTTYHYLMASEASLTIDYYAWDKFLGVNYNDFYIESTGEFQDNNYYVFWYNRGE